MIAQASSRARAEAFGYAHFSEFSGDVVEIDPASLEEAQEFWRVETVRLVDHRLDPNTFTTTHLWVRGPALPPEVEAEGLLTIEDRRALTLDHIERTSKWIGRVQILKWAVPSLASSADPLPPHAAFRRNDCAEA